jgi:hypothetical protein
MPDILNAIDFSKNAKFFIPMFMYAVGVAISLVIRGLDWGHLFTRELPRLGSELCKMACALLLGAIALGLGSIPLCNSPLGRRSDCYIVSSFILIVLVVLFLISYRCSYAIEGRRPWRGEIHPLSFSGIWLAGQAIGWGAFILVIHSLQGGE